MLARITSCHTLFAQRILPHNAAATYLTHCKLNSAHCTLQNCRLRALHCTFWLTHTEHMYMCETSHTDSLCSKHPPTQCSCSRHILHISKSNLHTTAKNANLTWRTLLSASHCTFCMMYIVHWTYIMCHIPYTLHKSLCKERPLTQCSCYTSCTLQVHIAHCTPLQIKASLTWCTPLSASPFTFCMMHTKHVTHPIHKSLCKEHPLTQCSCYISCTLQTPHHCISNTACQLHTMDMQCTSTMHVTQSSTDEKSTYCNNAALYSLGWLGGRQ